MDRKSWKHQSILVGEDRDETVVVDIRILRRNPLGTHTSVGMSEDGVAENFVSLLNFAVDLESLVVNKLTLTTTLH